MKTSSNLFVAIFATVFGTLMLNGNTWNTPHAYGEGHPGFSASATATITDNDTKLELEGYVYAHNTVGNGSRGYFFPKKVGPHDWGNWSVYNWDFVSYSSNLDAAPYRNTCVAYCSLVDSQSEASAYSAY